MRGNTIRAYHISGRYKPKTDYVFTRNSVTGQTESQKVGMAFLTDGPINDEALLAEIRKGIEVSTDSISQFPALEIILREMEFPAADEPRWGSDHSIEFFLFIYRTVVAENYQASSPGNPVPLIANAADYAHDLVLSYLCYLYSGRPVEQGVILSPEFQTLVATRSEYVRGRLGKLMGEFDDRGVPLPKHVVDQYFADKLTEYQAQTTSLKSFIESNPPMQMKIPDGNMDPEKLIAQQERVDRDVRERVDAFEHEQQQKLELQASTRRTAERYNLTPGVSQNDAAVHATVLTKDELKTNSDQRIGTLMQILDESLTEDLDAHPGTFTQNNEGNTMYQQQMQPQHVTQLNTPNGPVQAPQGSAFIMDMNGQPVCRQDGQPLTGPMNQINPAAKFFVTPGQSGQPMFDQEGLPFLMEIQTNGQQVPCPLSERQAQTTGQAVQQPQVQQQYQMPAPSVHQTAPQYNAPVQQNQPNMPVVPQIAQAKAQQAQPVNTPNMPSIPQIKRTPETFQPSVQTPTVQPEPVVQAVEGAHPYAASGNEFKVTVGETEYYAKPMEDAGARGVGANTFKNRYNVPANMMVLVAINHKTLRALEICVSKESYMDRSIHQPYRVGHMKGEVAATEVQTVESHEGLIPVTVEVTDEVVYQESYSASKADIFSRVGKMGPSIVNQETVEIIPCLPINEGVLAEARKVSDSVEPISREVVYLTTLHLKIAEENPALAKCLDEHMTAWWSTYINFRASAPMPGVTLTDFFGEGTFDDIIKHALAPSGITKEALSLFNSEVKDILNLVALDIADEAPEKVEEVEEDAKESEAQEKAPVDVSLAIVNSVPVLVLPQNNYGVETGKLTSSFNLTLYKQLLGAFTQGNPRTTSKLLWMLDASGVMSLVACENLASGAPDFYVIMQK